MIDKGKSVDALRAEVESLRRENSLLAKRLQQANDQLTNLTDLLDAVPFGIFEIDLAGKILWANRALLGLSDRDETQLVGLDVDEILLVNGKDGVLSAYDKRAIHAQQGVPEFPCKVRTSQGRTCEARLLLDDRTNKSGKRSGRRGFVLDFAVDDKRLAEQQGVENRYLRLTRAVSAMVFHFDLATQRYEYLVGAVEHITGFSAEQLREDSSLFRHAIHPDDYGKVRKGYRRMLETGELTWFEVRVARPSDRKPLWIRQLNLPLQDENGVVVSIEGVAQDITGYKEMQADLEKSNAFLKALIEQASFGILIAEGNPHDWKISLANEEATRILGAKEDQVLGLGFADGQLLNKESLDWKTLTPDGALCEPDAHPLALTMGGAQSTTNKEFIIRRPDGTDVDVLVNGSPIFDSSGELLGAAALFADISKHKTDQELRLNLFKKVQHAQKLESLGVLAGGIAHDFNNLLVGVLGNADLVLHALPEDSRYRYYLKQIERSALRATELASQMLAYSGKGQFVIRTIDLAEIVKETAELISVSISKKIRLSLDFSPNVPHVKGDATQIRQVVMNLITNGSDAMGNQSGDVILRTGYQRFDRKYLKNTYTDDDLPEGLYSYFEVEDSGCGMDESTLKKIFDPFFTTKFTGRGLGLAAVLGIVRGHNGAIDVISKKGKGTRFRVLFPVKEGTEKSESLEVAEETDPDMFAGTVLLVDDDDVVLTVGAAMLVELGFEVVTAKDGLAAIDWIRNHRGGCSLVILDLTMPVMMGDECYLEIRKIDRDVPVIISSGFNEQELSKRFPKVPIAGFIQKPYQIELLKKKINTAFQLGRKRKEEKNKSSR